MDADDMTMQKKRLAVYLGRSYAIYIISYNNIPPGFRVYNVKETMDFTQNAT